MQISLKNKLLCCTLSQVLEGTQLYIQPTIWRLKSLSSDPLNFLLSVDGCEAVNTERLSTWSGWKRSKTFRKPNESLWVW